MQVACGMEDRLYSFLVWILIVVGLTGAALLVAEMTGLLPIDMGDSGVFSVAASGLTMLLVALQFMQRDAPPQRRDEE